MNGIGSSGGGTSSGRGNGGEVVELVLVLVELHLVEQMVALHLVKQEPLAGHLVEPMVCGELLCDS